MLTINAEVVKNQRQSNGCFTVRLRFTLNRKMKRKPPIKYPLSLYL